jgi:tetratricopeptide (TPR) repeat protein
MLGELMAKRHDYSDAKTYYEKAWSQDGGQAVYHIRLGGAYLYLHDFNRAFEIFKSAAARFPDVPEIHYFLSVAARTRGESNLALTALQKALAINPNYADALALSGAILLDSGDVFEAEKLFRKAILANSNNYNANYNLGLLLTKQRKFDEALPVLQLASKLLPENAEVHYQLFLTYSRLNRKADANQELEIFKRLQGR